MIVILLACVVISFLLFYRFQLRKKQTLSQVSLCSICSEEFLDKELHVLEKVSLCSKDYIEFSANKWIEFKSFISDPDNPEESMQVYNLQKELRLKSIPSYITTEYSETNNIIYSSFTIHIKENDQNKLNYL